MIRVFSECIFFVDSHTAGTKYPKLAPSVPSVLVRHSGSSGLGAGRSWSLQDDDSSEDELIKSKL